ncbi:MAG: family 10 glycosylhydrolase [Fimbriimonadaceae bacterium]|nr:family 10 glycosylhydrolase [Fimbriimonadaceae bacterium]
MLSTILATTLMAQATPPPVEREFRAAWVATVDNIDWPTKPGLSSDQQKLEMVRILERAQKLNMNAIIFQIRPSADALYRSKLEPWSHYLSGQAGKGPDYDPLAFAIKEAHQRGLELHVWFNPYRAFHPAQKSSIPADHIANTHKDIVYSYGGYRWMDPGAKLVQDRSFEVFMDVVDRYDVDGIHIDDYFYPYPVRESGKVVPFPDSKTYAAYKQAGGVLSLSNWRRKNVDDFIERVYKGLKQRKAWVKFGISPFGIYRPGIPQGITAGVDQYEDLSADALKWWQEGWLDYFTPQLYWPIEQTAQSFPVLLEYWKSTNAKKRHLWPGLFTSRLGDNAPNWDAKQVVRQLQLTDEPAVNGAVHFSMKALMNDWKGIDQALLDGPYKDRKLVPASPWLGNKVPPTPSAKKEGNIIILEKPGTADARFFAIQQEVRGSWRLVKVVEAVGQSVVLKDSGAVAISLIDRVGNASAPRVLP